MPVVTIGLPTYNRASHLRETIPNILSQTWSDYELIVCDDASPDETEKVAKEFKDDRIRYFRNECNLGIPGNLNKILGLATGDYILFLHDHDFFRPDLIESMLHLYEKTPDLGFVHPGVAWIDPDGGNYKELLSDYEEVMDGRKLVEEMLLGENFSCPITACSLVSRKAYEAVGFYYDQRFGFQSDVDLWLRLAARFQVGYIRKPLIVCRGREKGHKYSGANWKMVDWVAEIHRENIERFFRGDQEVLDKVLTSWKKKKGDLTGKMVVTAIANGDIASFREGLERLRVECSGIRRFIGTSIQTFPSSHPLLLGVGSCVRQVMRKTRRTQGV